MYVELHGEKVREMREATELGAEDFAKEDYSTLLNQGKPPPKSDTE